VAEATDVLLDLGERKPGQSYADLVANLPADRIQSILDGISDATAKTLTRRPWWFMRRPEQEVPPGDWFVWLILSGRGWGKSRTGAETLVDWMLDLPTWEGVPTEWAIIGETIRDAREVCVLGPSGVIRVLERRGMVNGRDWSYHSTFSILTLHEHGQKVHVLGADDPDVARGLNLSGAWLDEIAKWRYSHESWIEGIAPALRIGPSPRAIVTTTPKPLKILKEWLGRKDGSVHVTRGSTFDNRSNLSRFALNELRARYEGTRIGRQELHGELLDDVEGALWQRAQIDRDRLYTLPPGVETIKRVVAVDPAVTSGEDADETGIIVAGKGTDGRGYVLADKSLQDTPAKWAQAIVDAFHAYECHEVVIEVNQGGDALETLIHTIDAMVPVVKVHAKSSKRVRAEPVSALYEKGLISHVGRFDTLEDQICSWTPEEVQSPDRMDALVYAFLNLYDSGAADSFLAALLAACPVCGRARVNGITVCGH
jgi:phage terminase large subunit-like protein